MSSCSALLFCRPALKTCRSTAQLQHSLVEHAHQAVIALLGVEIIFGYCQTQLCIPANVDFFL